MSSIGSLKRKIGWWLNGRKQAQRLLQENMENRDYLAKAYDDRIRVSAGDAAKLKADNKKLVDLRLRYAQLDLPAAKHMQWGERATDFISDHLKFFRGDTPYVWHYRDSKKVTELKYFVFLEYISRIDNRNLLDILIEDGAFGCWHFSYPGMPIVSRDLLDSINEILYLDRRLGIFEQENLRVLDVGAGYGRLAHRMVSALPNVIDYCCVDAIPESTFLCDFYLEHRELSPRARAVPLYDVQRTLVPGQFDLAVNVHSFSECTLEAVTWWVGEISRLKIPSLLIVPNEPDDLLTKEGMGVRLDFLPVLESAGYTLQNKEPVLNNPAVQELVDVYDQFYLFSKREP